MKYLNMRFLLLQLLALCCLISCTVNSQDLAIPREHFLEEMGIDPTCNTQSCWQNIQIGKAFPEGFLGIDNHESFFVLKDIPSVYDEFRWSDTKNDVEIGVVIDQNEVVQALIVSYNDITKDVRPLLTMEEIIALLGQPTNYSAIGVSSHLYDSPIRYTLFFEEQGIAISAVEFTSVAYGSSNQSGEWFKEIPHSVNPSNVLLERAYFFDNDTLPFLQSIQIGIGIVPLPLKDWPVNNEIVVLVSPSY